MSGRRHDRRGFTLTEMIVYMGFVGAVATASTYVLTRNAQVQSLAVAWADDDAVVQSILRRLREDVGLATQAGAAGGSVLRLDLPGGQVEYRFVAGEVRRSQSPSADPGQVWRLDRTALEWRIERLRKGAVVWTGVAIHALSSPEREPLVQRYAVAQRVGGAAPGGRP